MYRTAAQIESIMSTLSALFPNECELIPLPNRSIEGRVIHCVKLRGGPMTNRRGVLIVGGMHAREWINPDAVVELFRSLLEAYLNEHGLKFGGSHWSADDIRVIVETLDIFFLPCANPDGREYSMSSQERRLWRENRRDNPNTTCEGVDLNRNCDFMWGVTGNATCNPCSNARTFVGSGPFSEPESKNIEHLVNTFRIEVFLDIHSFSELVVFPWGHAPTQTTDPSKRFTTLTNVKCQGISPANHQEYMTPRDQLRFRTVADNIVRAIHDVQARTYTAKPIINVYNPPSCISGSAADFVYSRHIKNSAHRKVYGFSFETGPDLGINRLLESFQPVDPTPIKNEAKAGMLSLLYQSICGIDLIGENWLGRSLRDLTSRREAVLANSNKGREWLELFERVQGGMMSAVLMDQDLTKRAMSLSKASATVLEKRNGVLNEQLVSEASEFLDLVAKRSRPELKRDIAKLKRQLKSSAGKTVAAIVRELSGERAASRAR